VSIPFEEARLDDDAELAELDPYLRWLAESGARVRREARAYADAAERIREPVPPRAVVAAGTDARLLRAVLEPYCPVPFVAWPGPSLPGWAGPLDLVVVLAGDGGDQPARASVGEALRRGCNALVAAPAESAIARSVDGSRDAVHLATGTTDPFAVAVAVLTALHAWGLGPAVEPESVAAVLDDVATRNAPRRQLGDNPGKDDAIALAEHTPLVWGGSVLAARAGRRVAEQLRLATGLAVLAADAEQLARVLAGTPRPDVFADPFADGPAAASPVLLLLEDGSTDPAVREQSGRLRAAADAASVRVVPLAAPASDGVVDEYASLLQQGSYAAAYLALGLGRGRALVEQLG